MNPLELMQLLQDTQTATSKATLVQLLRDLAKRAERDAADIEQSATSVGGEMSSMVAQIERARAQYEMNLKLTEQLQTVAKHI